METIKGGSSPAFPADSTSNGYGGRTPQTYSGLTIQQYAAIHLRVPNSGDAALDDMIRQSLHNEFATSAMKGFLAGHISHYGHESHWPYGGMVDEARQVADAMLKASKEGGSS